jgi:hypothetical protein
VATVVEIDSGSVSTDTLVLLSSIAVLYVSRDILLFLGRRVAFLGAPNRGQWCRKRVKTGDEKQGGLLD